MTTPQTLPGYTPPFRAEPTLPYACDIVDAVGKVLAIGVQVEHADDLLIRLNAHSPLVEAIRSALPFLQESWKHMGLGGQFEMMDSMRTALSLAGVRG